jgi:hypothetical protein
MVNVPPQGTAGCRLYCFEAACTAAGFDWSFEWRECVLGVSMPGGAALLCCPDICFDQAGDTLAGRACTSCSSGHTQQGCVCTPLL